MAQVIYLTLLALVWIAVISSGSLWVRFLVRWAHGEARFGDLVAARPRKQPFWTLADFLLMFGTLLVGLILFTSALTAQESIGPESQAADLSLQTLIGSLVANALAGILAVVVTLSWLCILFRSTAIEELGLIPTAADVRLGLRAALWLLPPIGLISLAVSLLVPYEHPVLNTLAQSPTLSLFGLLFLGTAVIAPLVEELMFRVLLQGSLERAAESMRNATSSELAATGENSDELTVVTKQTPDEWAPTAYWPIVVTSIIFAMMHFGQGAAPIPLFVLSLGLGYLFRQTGRITPSLVVHMVLNTTTLLVEFARFAAAAE